MQVNVDGLPISSSFADISNHPPTINELTTDSTVKPGNNGVIKGLVSHYSVVHVQVYFNMLGLVSTASRIKRRRVLHQVVCCAGFLLQKPAVVFIGSVKAEIKQHERASISFTYPQLAPGEYDLTVQRGSRTSNTIKVTINAAAAGLTSLQGGPFADTPKYKQLAVQFSAVCCILWLTMMCKISHDHIHVVAKLCLDIT